MAGKLARLLIINRWGRLALLTAILVLLLLVYQDLLLEEVYPLVRDTVLRTVGFGFFPLALWLSTAVAVMRLEPRWLARRWRWWLSAALLATGIQAALGGVHGPEGIIADKTLGGIAGQYMWGNSPLQGVPVTAVALLLAATVLHPAMTYRAGVAITRTLAQLLLLLGYWLIRGAGSMAQRATTLHRITSRNPQPRTPIPKVSRSRPTFWQKMRRSSLRRSQQRRPWKRRKNLHLR